MYFNSQNHTTTTAPVRSFLRACQTELKPVRDFPVLRNRFDKSEIGLTNPSKPVWKRFIRTNQDVTISNYVFNFNYLALVLSEILEGSQIYIRRPCPPRRPPSGKNLTRAQVLAYIYIIANFQLRSSINAELTERSLYNWFCIERSAKMGFWGDFGRGTKIFGGNPLRMQ